MKAPKPMRRDVTNTQWQQFTSQFNQFVNATNATLKDIETRLQDLQAHEG